VYSWLNNVLGFALLSCLACPHDSTLGKSINDHRKNKKNKKNKKKNYEDNQNSNTEEFNVARKTLSKGTFACRYLKLIELNGKT